MIKIEIKIKTFYDERIPRRKKYIKIFINIIFN